MTLPEGRFWACTCAGSTRRFPLAFVAALLARTSAPVPRALHILFLFVAVAVL